MPQPEGYVLTVGATGVLAEWRPSASVPSVGYDARRDTTAARGLWYPAGLRRGVPTRDGGLALAANTLVALPIDFPEAISVPKFGFLGTWADAAHFVGMALYAQTGINDTYPDVLLAECNSMAMVNNWQEKALDAAFTAPAGSKLFLAIVGDAAVVLQFLSGDPTAGNIGYTTAWMLNAANHPPRGWKVAHNYVPGNGMPDPFPVGGTFYTGAASGQVPGLWIGGW